MLEHRLDAARSVRSQLASRPSPAALPRAPLFVRCESPIRIQSPSPADSAGAGWVCLTAYGGPSSGSNSTNQSDARGSTPGFLWTVWRIQTPRRAAGSHARR